MHVGRGIVGHGRRPRTVALTAGSILLAAALSVNCTVPLPRPQETGGILDVALESPVLTLDPAVATDLSSFRVIAQVCETLVELDTATGAPSPLLAQSWAVSGDGRLWTFTLRSGITFHDGTPLNADAVVQNFQRWMDPTNPYHHGDLDYWQIVFGGFKGSGSIVRSVDRVDDLRFRLTLEEPWSPLLAALAQTPFAIVSPKTMRDDVDALRRHPVGTGPFRFREWRADNSISLTANAAYWGGPPKVAGVHFQVISDPQAALGALREGKVHIVEGSDAAAVAAARRIPSVKVLLRPSRTTVFLSVNQNAEFLGDVRVRQAMAQAINRQAIVERIYGGLAQTADQFVPPAISGHDRGLAPLTYSIESARAALSAAGYRGIITQLWYPSRARLFLPKPRAMAESIAADLRVVGIVAAVNGTDWATYQHRSLEGGYPLYIQTWTGDIPTAESYLYGLFATDAVSRSIGYANAELRALLLNARAERDIAAQMAIYRQAASIVRADAPRIPLVHPQSPLLTTAKVSGLILSPLAAESYRGVKLGK